MSEPVRKRPALHVTRGHAMRTTVGGLPRCGAMLVAFVVVGGCSGEPASEEAPAPASSPTAPAEPAEPAEPEASGATPSASPVPNLATRGVTFSMGERVWGERLAARTEGRVTIAVHEPYEQREVRFEALPAVALFDEVFGAEWRAAEELVFDCADGYRAAVPVSRFLEHHAYLAVAREQSDFAIDKPVGGAVERTLLAPAYLIWENLLDAQVRDEGDWGWPYQIIAVSMTSTAVHYGRMAPPAGADPSVLRGFATFRRYCSRCHAINGQGGTVGPELNYPASVTEYLEPSWLRRWIDAPLTVRHGTAMPGLPPGVPEREAALDDLIVYLTAMAGRKLAPAEPAAPAVPGAH